ncbi:(2Fe-2S)-binding protein [Dietzia sp. NPDC055340]
MSDVPGRRARGDHGGHDDEGRAPGAVASAYERVSGPLGDFARTIEHGPRVLPGSVLTDPRWLARRVADTGRRWSHDDPRVNGTLWWYSASSSLVAAPLTMLLTAGLAPDPRPERLTVSLQPNGYLKAARSDRLLASVGEFANALCQAHAEVIAALAEVSGATPRALWAIATDSIGNRALEAGRAVGDGDRVDGAGGGGADRGAALARTVCRPPLLPVRYVDVDGPQRSRRFVRRSSCCLIYVATGGDKCVSCPRRTPQDRQHQLTLRS